MAGAQGEGAGRRGRCSALAALGARLCRALCTWARAERGTDLRSQRSHRDERRSRRLGFSLRPAPPVPRPDRWESATGTRAAPPAPRPGVACAPEGSNPLGGFVSRGG